ncbi:restriction endonuclease subunit S [Anaerolineales bacterium HSG6]|nr:restriction endonuclease subunit S [Anaerolineales bacterium HSG6]
MSFQFSADLNTDKIFLINHKNLEGRLDAEYYQPSHYRDINLLVNSPYPLDKLDNVCTRIVDGPFGSAIKAEDYVEEGIPFIRVADITHGEGTIKTDNLIFISNEAHQKISRSKIVPGDVVIAKTGATMGAASVVPESIVEANIRGDLGALTVIEKICSPQYLITYINTEIGQRLFWRLDSGGTRGRVVIGNLKKYPILIPPKEIQAEIVTRMGAAYEGKNQKETEAQRLLDSIDAYLLDELGIQLPEAKENTVEKQVFILQFKELQSRLDPFFYKKEFKVIEMNISKSPWKVVSLEEIFQINRGGSPRPINNYFTDEEDGINWIKIGDTKNDDKYIYQTKQKIKPEGAKHSRKVSEGDFILSNSMSFGRPYIMKISGYIHDGWLLFKPKTTNINKDYLHSILSSQLIYKLFKKSTLGGVVDNLNIDLVKKVKIPLPSLNKQNEIANHITTIRNQAKQLQQQAKTELAQAKQEVEQLILGE